MLAGPVLLFPNFPYALFNWSMLICLGLTILLAPFASQLDRAHLTGGWSPDSLRVLQQLGRAAALDPVVFHVAWLVLTMWLTYKLARGTGFPAGKSVWMALAPILALGIAHAFLEFVMKPGFDFPRPAGYRIADEPPLLQGLRIIFYSDRSTPSGFVGRQMVLMLSTILLTTHRWSPVQGKPLKLILILMSVLSVLLVGVQRVVVGAHSLFDVTLALAAGAMVFWITYVLPYSLFQANGAPRAVVRMYLAFTALMVFYSQLPVALTISSLAIAVALLALDGLSDRIGWSIPQH